ncbi:MAG: hypothetical protein ACRDYE_05880, partial [Acidimicrobiales bacterium]
PAASHQESSRGGWVMAEGDVINAAQQRVHDLEGQVTAFTGLSEAIRAVDGVLGRASEELAGAGGGASHRTMWAGRREVRTVALA